MADAGQALLTAGMTTGFGAVVAGAGYLAVRLVLEPILEQRRVRERIAHALTYYANYYPIGAVSYTEQRDKLQGALDALRALAADLRRTRHSIPFYRLLAKLRFVIDRANLNGAAAELIPGLTQSRRR